MEVIISETKKEMGKAAAGKAAEILRKHKKVFVFLDKDSAKLL